MGHVVEGMNTVRENWYFTFGVGQKLANNFVVIRDETFERARRRMNDTYGPKWAFQYSEKDFLPQIEKYRLQEVVFGTPNRFDVETER